MIQFVAMAAAGGALVGSLFAGYLMAEYKDTMWTSALLKQQISANDLLLKETVRVGAVQDEAKAKVRELEAVYAEKEKDLLVVQRRNRELATQLGGLRDPGRRASRPDAMPTVASATDRVDQSASSGHLSAEATGLLLSAAAEVDALAEYARACYEWKETVTQMFQKDEQ